VLRKYHGEDERLAAGLCRNNAEENNGMVYWLALSVDVIANVLSLL